MPGATVFRLNSLPISSQFEISHHIGMNCDVIDIGSTQIISYWSDNLISEGLRISQTQTQNRNGVGNSGNSGSRKDEFGCPDPVKLRLTGATPAHIELWNSKNYR